MYGQLKALSYQHTNDLRDPSIATKTHVTAAFLLFVLVPIGGAAVPLDKMSIQTCGPTTSPPGCVVLGPDMSSIWTHPPHPIQGGGEMGWSEIDKITFLTRQLYPTSS